MKQFDSFRLDTKNECLWRDGGQITLPPRPFMVLRYLVENPGRLITHDELLDALWPETYVQPQVLRTYMLELRKVLGDDAARPRFIQTLPKRGYCFVAPVSDCGDGERGTAAEIPLRGEKPEKTAGRAAELAALEKQIRLAAAGQRQVVFITGEAGIGKTALVDAFCRRAGLSSAVNLASGQCVEGFSGKEEYYPVMEALSRLCAAENGEQACEILARLAPAWLAALGRQPAASAAPRPAHERMAGDLCAALEELAARKPLVLVFEDLHWADRSTLDLISALARRRAPAALMLIATCAPGDGMADPAFREMKQNLLMRQLSTEIALPPLTRNDVSAMLRGELQQETLPPGLAGFVHQHSEGNPLFAIALLEHLVARRFLVREGKDEVCQWKLCGRFEEMESEVPGRLAQMIELEIDRLSPEEQSILGAGSIAGIAFPVWAVAAALEEEPSRIEETCACLARRLHYLERAGEDELPGGARSEFYVFVHGLYREVLHQRQPAMRRAQWHLRIANRLAELFSGSEATVAREMAMHYEAAGEWHRAAGALRVAARYEFDRNSPEEAAQLLQHALRMAENLREAERPGTVRLIRDEMMANARTGNQDGDEGRRRPAQI